MKAVEINGKQYPCRITMGAMLRFKRETGKDVTQMNTSDVAELITLLWCCIVSASKADAIHVSLANPSVTESKTVELEFDALKPSKVSGEILRGKGKGIEAVKSYNDFGGKTTVQPVAFRDFKE